jgi:hypothetical protein
MYHPPCGVTMGAYVESWDGEGCRPRCLPTSRELMLYGVSCPNASFCEVVGTGRGATLAPVAEARDGTSWHDQSIPGA